jgi:hypothetical protein
MGCDIHLSVEKKQADGSYEQVDLELSYFDNRNYDFFGWLANVRNYCGVMDPIAAHRGIPENSPAFEMVKRSYYYHSGSWVSVNELLTVCYEDTFVYSRGAKPERITYRELLGEDYFKDLEAMRKSSVDRVVFWFDC